MHRFPRYISTREDKQPEDASDPDFIEQMYNKQTRKQDPTAGQPQARQQKISGGSKALADAAEADMEAGSGDEDIRDQYSDDERDDQPGTDSE